MLGRGIYPRVEDVDIENDRIHSLQQIPLQAAIQNPIQQSFKNGQDFLTFHGDPYRLGWNSMRRR